MEELLNAPDRVLALFPEWFAPRQPDWPSQTRFVGFPLWDAQEAGGLPEPLERFLAAGEAPIAFTLSSTDWKAREFYRAAVGACCDLSCRGVLLTPERDSVPSPLPPEVIRVDYAPFRRLLPRVSALVHHGGLGTGAQALAAGSHRSSGRPVSTNPTTPSDWRGWACHGPCRTASFPGRASRPAWRNGSTPPRSDSVAGFSPHASARIPACPTRSRRSRGRHPPRPLTPRRADPRAATS